MMGSAGSTHSDEGALDSVCSTHSSPQQSASNGLAECEGEVHVSFRTKDNDAIAVGEELWLKQIQDLGKVIQNLASENLKLLDFNKELKQKYEEQESRLSERNSDGREKEVEFNENLQMVKNLQEAAANDNKVIEDLKQQLQTNTKNSAVEIEKYHENLNFMHLKVKEYEQVVAKLEEDAAMHNDSIRYLQSTLLSADNQENVVDQSASKMKEVIDKLKQEHKDCQEENKSLMEQFEMEKDMRRQVSDENKKLQDELQQIKQIMCLHAVKRSSENSDEDGSDVGINEQTEQSPIASCSNKNEEARTLSPRVAAELEMFQNQLKVKREARHKALSAISMEMERLRRELNSEREIRRNAVRELETARNISDAHNTFSEINSLKDKLISERQEKDKIYKELVETQKQGNEEIENVIKQLEKERARTEHVMGENKYMREQLEESDNMLQQRSEENSQLQNKLETDREKYQQQVLALKDVVAISKQMLTVRENQVTHLKQTLQDIEVSVIEKHRGSLTAELRAEYEKQMENMKTLKALYEERTQVMNVEKEKLINEQKELQRLIEEEKRTVETLETKLQEMEGTISERNATVSDLQDQLSDAIDQSRNLSNELSLINNMFTQILGSSDMDLDRLTKLLQENHDLITEITTKSDCSETTASLPKLLLDIVCHAENAENNTSEKGQECSNQKSDDTLTSSMVHTVSTEQNEAAGQSASVSSNSSPLAMQDISSNLPKVWKVLLELVSHHVPSPAEETSEESKTSCYKSVDTPYGPKNVISVSKTFIRLRDLILQKKSLQKEVTRLKQLNVHLETKLNDQERRLSLVSSELRKTWNVVDHMRVQHQQLHTHEKVLRYELQQKRKLLMELKEELEYCREKWEDARQKNSQSETEWQILRKEFALRKNKPLNNSGESGFSEEKDEESSDNDVTKIQSQRKTSSRGFSNLHHADCIEQAVLKTDVLETVTNSTTSLPDLVAVAPELPLAPSDVPVPTSAIATSDVTMDVTSGVSIPLLQNIMQNAFSLHNDNNGSSVLEPSLLEECPTVSLVTLLKQQLSCFSQNLEIITTDFDTNDHFRALQSIFALPAIQIPEHLNPFSEEPSTSYFENNSNISTRASIDRGIQCTEECSDNDNEKEVPSPPSLDDGEVTLQEQQEQENSIEISSLSTIPQPCGTDQEKSFASLGECVEEPGSSCNSGAYSSSENIQRESRTERLQRLERQCQQLFDKVTRRSDVSNTAPETKDQIKMQEGSNGPPTRNLEDMLDARAARLKRLEEQSQQLFKKVTRTTHRSTVLSNRLEELHEQYGSEDAAGNADNAVSKCLPTDPSSSKLPDPPPLPNELENLPTSDSSENNFTSISGPSSFLPHIPTAPPIEDMLDTHAARLQQLEGQSQLCNEVTKTTHCSAVISNLLEDLHEQYGSDEEMENGVVSAHLNSETALSNIPEPPPFPHHLIPSNLPISVKSTNSNEDMQNESLCPSPSTSSSHIPIPLPLEDILDARGARLKRLEEESHQLFNKVKRTTDRSTELSNRLEELHEQYGSEDSTASTTDHSGSLIPDAPPLPDRILPIRLPTSCQLSPSSHIPTPPPLPPALPLALLPAQTDHLRSHNNLEEKVYEEGKEER